MKIKRRNFSRLIENYLFEAKYPYVDDKDASDDFRKWVMTNRPKIAGKYDITSETGTTTWWGLPGAYEKTGKDFEQDRSYFGLGSYFSDYSEEELASTEKDDKSQKSDIDVVYHDRMPENFKLSDPSEVAKGKATFVKKCSQAGCAAWVASIVGFQGNAWHAHRGAIEYTAFEGSNIESNLDEIVRIFNLCNKKPKARAYDSSVKKLVKKMIPDQSQFSSIPLGSVVGLYYPTSKNFTVAFYEGGTGTSQMGLGYNPSDPSGQLGNFVTKEGEPWNPKHRGTKTKFVASKSRASGKGFGMNTHLGYVGAYVNGEPVIFHNIGPGTRDPKKGRVIATPLSAMSQKKLMIFWYKDPDPGLLTRWFGLY